MTKSLVKHTKHIFFCQEKNGLWNFESDFNERSKKQLISQAFYGIENLHHKGVGIKMDQEIKRLFGAKVTLLATKDDIEKIRQETNANFRKLKEENKSQATEWNRRSR